jgi:hypothetical protein
MWLPTVSAEVVRVATPPLSGAKRQQQGRECEHSRAQCAEYVCAKRARERAAFDLPRCCHLKRRPKDRSFAREGLYSEATLSVATEASRTSNSLVNFSRCCLASANLWRMNQQFNALS